MRLLAVLTFCLLSRGNAYALLLSENPGPPDSSLLSDYAVDIIGASASVPEPGTFGALAISMAAIIVTIPIKKKQRRSK
jgi:hypothetical protein